MSHLGLRASKIAFGVVAVLLVLIAVVGREVWIRGGPDQYYWAGDIAMGTFLVLNGVAILVKPEWYYQRGVPIRRLGRIAASAIAFLFAALFLGLSLIRIALACRPVGNCPP